MIKINLLPKKERGKRTFRFECAVMIGVVGLTVAVVGGIFWKNTRDIAALRAQKADLARERESLGAVAREVQAMDGQKKEILARIAAIDRIKEGRAIAPRMLYDLSSLVTDTVWLKRLRKDEGRFGLEGRSVDNESICAFVQGLSGLPYMKNVELKSVEEVTETGAILKKFLVEGSVVS